jgi:hypothetical protein
VKGTRLSEAELASLSAATFGRNSDALARELDHPDWPKAIRQFRGLASMVGFVAGRYLMFAPASPSSLDQIPDSALSEWAQMGLEAMGPASRSRKRLARRMLPVAVRGWRDGDAVARESQLRKRAVGEFTAVGLLIFAACAESLPFLLAPWDPERLRADWHAGVATTFDKNGRW